MRVVEFPRQIAGFTGLMTAVGSGLTVTVFDVVAVHEFISVTVTEYGVVIVGETGMDDVLAALLHA